MAHSQAKTGDIAAKAGASSGGPAAGVEAENTAPGSGAAAVAANAAANPAENAPKTDEKAADVVVDVVEKAAETIKTVVKDAAQLSKPENGVKIKMLRSHPEYAYHAGEEGYLAPEHAEKLVAGGFAQVVTAAETESEPQA